MGSTSQLFMLIYDIRELTWSQKSMASWREFELIFDQMFLPGCISLARSQSVRASSPSHHRPYELLVLNDTTRDLLISSLSDTSEVAIAYTMTPRTVIVMELILRLVSVNAVTH